MRRTHHLVNQRNVSMDIHLHNISVSHSKSSNVNNSLNRLFMNSFAIHEITRLLENRGRYVAQLFDSNSFFINGIKNPFQLISSFHRQTKILLENIIMNLITGIFLKNHSFWKKNYQNHSTFPFFIDFSQLHLIKISKANEHSLAIQFQIEYRMWTRALIRSGLNSGFVRCT